MEPRSELEGKTLQQFSQRDEMPDYLSQARIKLRPRIKAIAIEGYGDPKESYSEKEKILKKWLRRKKEDYPEINQNGSPFGVYYTSRMKAGVENVVWDACLPLNQEVHPEEKIKYRLLPETKVLSITLSGSYSLIGPSLKYMEKLAEENDNKIGWPLTEIYLEE